MSNADVDLYRIYIDTPSVFSASTCGGAVLDTHLFLFDANGLGVVANNDSFNCTFPNPSWQSLITNGLVNTPGVYYLGITQFSREPSCRAS